MLGTCYNLFGDSMAPKTNVSSTFVALHVSQVWAKDPGPQYCFPVVFLFWGSLHMPTGTSFWVPYARSHNRVQLNEKQLFATKDCDCLTALHCAAFRGHVAFCEKHLDELKWRFFSWVWLKWRFMWVWPWHWGLSNIAVSQKFARQASLIW